MGWFDWLVTGHEAPTTDATEVVQRIAALLEGLEPEHARYLGAFAYLLARVAHIDNELTEAEVGAMRALLAREGDVEAHDAHVVVDLAQALSRAERGTEDFRVAREFSRIATREQQLGLIRCLFAVAAADATVSLAEDNEIRRVTQELGIEHEDFIRARLAVREHLSVTRPPARAR
mgnify:CR=1 FL=1